MLVLYGEYHNTQSALDCVFGDTLAAHRMVRFKVGLVLAQKMCGNSEYHSHDMRAVFLSSSCILKSDDVRKYRCMTLEGDLPAITGQ
jgi:hypothetical protein